MRRPNLVSAPWASCHRSGSTWSPPSDAAIAGGTCIPDAGYQSATAQHCKRRPGPAAELSDAEGRYGLFNRDIVNIDLRVPDRMIVRKRNESEEDGRDLFSTETMFLRFFKIVAKRA